MSRAPRAVRRWIAAALAAAVLAASAGADFDIELVRGGNVSARTQAADDIALYHVRLARGAALSLSAAPAKGAPAVDLVLLDSSGAQVAAGTLAGTATKLSYVAPATGRYSIEVSGDGVATGAYRLKVTWKTTPTTFTLRPTLGAAPVQVSFVADAGARADFSVKAVKGSAARPRLVQAVALDGSGRISFTTPAAEARSQSSKKRLVPSTGDWLLTVGNAGTDGDVAVTVRVRQPRAEKKARTITTVPEPPDEAPDVTNASFGTGGGVLAPAPDVNGDPSTVTGARLDVPPGALRSNAVLQIGAGDDVSPPSGVYDATGPAVYFGPAGQQFVKPVTVTIPLDASRFADGDTNLRILERDEQGGVTILDPPAGAIDAAAGTVSFQVKHFTSFQAVSVLDQRKLLPDDTIAGDGLGASVAVSGDTLAVGVRQHGLRGAVYVYVRSGSDWSLQQIVQPLGAATGGVFGTSVALDGDLLAVAAPLDDEGAGAVGAVYLFRRAGQVWTQEEKLVASDGDIDDLFGGPGPGDGEGRGIAVRGDTVLVGAPGVDGVGADSGAVYVFIRDMGTWEEDDKLTPAVGAAGEFFGARLSFDGDLLAVGAQQHDSPAGVRGAVYVFERSLGFFQEERRIVAIDAFGQGFGADVALSGTTLAVGAPADAQDGAGAGAVYVFTRSSGNWPIQAKVRPSPGEAGSGFGRAVALDGNLLVAGAPRSAAFGPAGTGRAVAFTASAGVWTERRRFASDDAAPGDLFGSAIVLSGQRVVAGVSSADARGADSGAAYVFEDVGR